MSKDEKLELKPLGRVVEHEYAMDQFKNIYKRLIGTILWECIFYYRRITKNRVSNTKDMTLIGEIDNFSFAVDSEGKYWKKVGTNKWTEFSKNENRPRYFMHEVIVTQADRYWTKQKNNKTIFKYTVDTSNVDITRKKEYYDFITNSRIRKKHPETKRIQKEEEEEQALKKRKESKEFLKLFT